MLNQNKTTLKQPTRRFADIVFRTVSPLFIPGFDTVKKEGEKEYVVCAVHRLQLNETDGSERQYVEIPVISGNNIKNRARREAADDYMQQVLHTANGSRLSRVAFQTLTSGSPGFAKPDDSNIVVEDFIRDQRDLYLGVFGGSTRLSKSGIKVGTAYPIMRGTINAGLVPQSLTRYMANPNGEEGSGDFPYVMSKFTMIKRDEMIKGAASAQKFIEDYAEAFAKYLEDIKFTKDNGHVNEFNQSFKAGEKVDLNNFINSIVVNAGVCFHTRIEFEPYLSDKQIRFAVSAIAKILSKPIGSKSSIGFGRLSVIQEACRYYDGVDADPKALFVNTAHEDLGVQELVPASDIGEDFSDELHEKVSKDYVEKLCSPRMLKQEKEKKGGKKKKTDESVSAEDADTTEGEE